MGPIPYPLVLAGSSVTLESLDERHFSSLLSIADDRRIWEHYVFDGTDKTRLSVLLVQALQERERGTQYPWVIHHNRDNRIVGSTRLMDIQYGHRKLEIGTTWLQPAYWGTDVNLECKLLLLTYCFESMGTARVQLKTDVLNTRSRRAIEKIGGSFEGILRHDMIRDNGTNRDSALYSITDFEWPAVRHRLAEMYVRNRARV